MKNFLSGFPSFDLLYKEMTGISFPEFREANGHIHTPYSFSSFNALDTAFKMAVEEKIAVLGINDFYVTDGYNAFHEGCMINKIFPLFNIEFIGLLKEEQKKGIRINDPNDPGRIYFSGKGLDYPFKVSWLQRRQLRIVKKESQAQIKAMIVKLNQLIQQEKPDIELSYSTVKKIYAHELVRERHIAKALRELVINTSPVEEEQLHFLESLYGGKKSKTGMSKPAALENEIRANLLKNVVYFFHQKGFIITFGTEHNTPEMMPLTVTTRGSVALDDSLKKIAYEGACVIAAHQYLRADGRQGYVLPDGTHSVKQTRELINLGQLVIEYFLNKYEYEA